MEESYTEKSLVGKVDIANDNQKTQIFMLPLASFLTALKFLVFMDDYRVV
jgi:hypothetical protein